jgi:NUMOD3 motif
VLTFPTHRHHIVPHHMSGDDEPDNLTGPISIAMHAALHKDLYEHFGKQQDLVAWRLLAGYAITGKDHPRTGKPHSKETKKKMSQSKKANPPFLGHTHTEEAKKKMSLAHLGKKRGPYGPHSEKTLRKMRTSRKGIKDTSRYGQVFNPTNGTYRTITSI